MPLKEIFHTLRPLLRMASMWKKLSSALPRMPLKVAKKKRCKLKSCQKVISHTFTPSLARAGLLVLRFLVAFVNKHKRKINKLGKGKSDYDLPLHSSPLITEKDLSHLLSSPMLYTIFWVNFLSSYSSSICYLSSYNLGPKLHDQIWGFLSFSITIK